MKIIPPALLLAPFGLLTSCSQIPNSERALANFSVQDLNPFRKQIPIRQVNADDLAKLKDYTIAAHGVDGIPDASLRPVDYAPPALPNGLDLLQASLLPPKDGGRAAVIETEGEVPEHLPIIPTSLLDEAEGAESGLSPEALTEEAPLVPGAPTSVTIGEEEPEQDPA